MEEFPIKLRKVEFVTSATKPKQYPLPYLREVAFSGRSNVGKSSLINAMVQRKNLVKVSGTPGRTQLINFFNVNDELSVVDLPGYGYAKVPHDLKRTWGSMLDTYLQKRETLCAVVVLMDLRRGIEEDDLQLIQALPYFSVQPILVFTKSDKYKRNAREQRRRELAKEFGFVPEDLVLTSSSKNFGLAELWQRIIDMTSIKTT